VCRSKHVEPSSINFGIINSITKLHLVGISTESYYDARIHEYQIYSPTYSLPRHEMEVRNKFPALTGLPPVAIKYGTGWAPDSVWKFLNKA
jgi:hypothetical protein